MPKRNIGGKWYRGTKAELDRIAAEAAGRLTPESAFLQYLEGRPAMEQGRLRKDIDFARYDPNEDINFGYDLEVPDKVWVARDTHRRHRDERRPEWGVFAGVHKVAGLDKAMFNAQTTRRYDAIVSGKVAETYKSITRHGDKLAEYIRTGDESVLKDTKWAKTKYYAAGYYTNKRTHDYLQWLKDRR